MIVSIGFEGCLVLELNREDVSWIQSEKCTLCTRVKLKLDNQRRQRQTLPLLILK